jgi:hypothetical protein
MKFVVIAVVALILIVAGVWYFSKSEGMQRIQQRQQAQPAVPAPQPSPSSTAATEVAPVAVPFVGCEDLGMAGVSAAPKGSEKIVKIHASAAGRLAWIFHEQIEKGRLILA